MRLLDHIATGGIARGAGALGFVAVTGETGAVASDAGERTLWVWNTKIPRVIKIAKIKLRDSTRVFIFSN